MNAIIFANIIAIATSLLDVTTFYRTHLGIFHDNNAHARNFSGLLETCGQRATLQVEDAIESSFRFRCNPHGARCETRCRTARSFDFTLNAGGRFRVPLDGTGRGLCGTLSRARRRRPDCSTR